jgi:hypothetical protein
MSWLYSRALVEEFLVDSCLDGEQSAQLSGNLTQQAFCAPDKMMDFSRLSRFGMTYKPLTADRGQELLTLYLAAFHAKTLVPQEKAQELMENEAECGEKWRGSFVKYDPDSSLWRTHQCSLLGDLEQFLETWPQWGLMRDGECWEQQMLKPHTKETGYGLWPTPNTCDATRGSPETPQQKLNRGANTGWSLIDVLGYIPHPEFAEWLMGWPLGWTDLKPSEMDKSHCAQQQPGAS